MTIAPPKDFMPSSDRKPLPVIILGGQEAVHTPPVNIGKPCGKPENPTTDTTTISMTLTMAMAMMALPLRKKLTQPNQRFATQMTQSVTRCPPQRRQSHH